MARRRKDQEPGVSLFPFMSILACLIGILTLMISVMTRVQQMKQEGKTEEELSLAMKNRDLLREEQELKSKVKEQQEQLEREKITVAEMAKLKDRSIALTRELEGLEKATGKDDRDLELQKEVENLQDETAALVKGRPALNQRLKQLQVELEKRRNPSMDDRPVVVQPRGFFDEGPKTIFFVECNSTGIVLLDAPEGKKRIATEAIEKSGIYGAYLTKVKKTPDSMVLFLVRRTGGEAFRWAAGIAETKFKVDAGKLPLPSDGDIDLSLFKK